VLLEMKLWARSAVLLSIVGYVIAIDCCLLINSKPSPFRNYPVLWLAFILQACSFAALAALVMWTGRYFEVVNAHLKTAVLRASAGVWPFLLLLASVDLLAQGLYNKGRDNRIEDSRMRIEAIHGCYLFGYCSFKRHGSNTDGGSANSASGF
jgi:hypothetical protein